MSCNKSIQAKLTKNLLYPIILQILNHKPKHGYEILSIIRKSFGVRFGASTIYPILNKMEKDNYLKSSWNTDARRPQKVYQITLDGKAVLDYTLESLQSICMTFDKKNNKIKKDSTENRYYADFLKSEN
jgi:DNA-binding PadR family transcriptional regulator